MTPFKNILVVVDSSQADQPQLRRALKLAEHGGVKLHLVDVIKDVSLTVRLLSPEHAHIHEALVKEKREQLQRLVEHCAAHAVPADGEVLEGVSSQMTLAAAKRVGAELIIRGIKGTSSLQAGRLGTSSQKLLQRLTCPLWLVDPEHEPDIKTIVAAVDATPDDDAHQQINHRILQLAIGLATRERAGLLVCYVWSLYGSDMLRHRLPESEFKSLLEFNRRQHRESFEALLSSFDLHASGPSARMLEGEPSEAIPQICEQEQADLLICGTVARQGMSGLLLGNTAERIANQVACSVLAVTPQP